MVKRIVLLFIFCSFSVQGTDPADYSLVFIHIGAHAPAYLTDVLVQARMFNPECPLYLLVNCDVQLDCTHPVYESVEKIYLETIQKTEEHEQFLAKTRLNSTFRDGFWRHTSERFLYLHDFMVQYRVPHVFHVENDVMLYVDIGQVFAVFQAHYPDVAATFDNDEQCIPGIIYIAHEKAMQIIADCFARGGRKYDMMMLADCKQKHPTLIQQLPIIMPEYIQKHRLVSKWKHTVHDPNMYCNHIQDFNSLFDAAALGQFLGGIDPRNGESKPGYIRETTVFNPSYLKYVWKIDEYGRRVPYARYKGAEYRINNLHIHCKNMKPFMSK